MSLAKLRFTNQAFSEASLKTFLPGGSDADAKPTRCRSDAGAPGRGGARRIEPPTMADWPIGPDCRDLAGATVVMYV
jgi:hypothetical protein